MNIVVSLTLLAFLAACGIKRPLIPPSEIPAYEQKQEKRKNERDEFRREQQQQPITPQT